MGFLVGLVWYSLQFFINTMCGSLCSVLGVCLAVCGLSGSRKLVLYNLQFFINTTCGSLCSVSRACLVVGGLSSSRRLVLYNLQLRL